MTRLPPHPGVSLRERPSQQEAQRRCCPRCRRRWPALASPRRGAWPGRQPQSMSRLQARQTAADRQQRGRSPLLPPLPLQLLLVRVTRLPPLLLPVQPGADQFLCQKAALRASAGPQPCSWPVAASGGGWDGVQWACRFLPIFAAGLHCRQGSIAKRRNQWAPLTDAWDDVCCCPGKKAQGRMHAAPSAERILHTSLHVQGLQRAVPLALQQHGRARRRGGGRVSAYCPRG